MPQEASQRDPRRIDKGAVVSTAVAGLLVLYAFAPFLLFAPAFWVWSYTNDDRLESAIEVAIYPLEQLSDHSASYKAYLVWQSYALAHAGLLPASFGGGV